MISLLSVDWDFFFDRPWVKYDWGIPEETNFSIEKLWVLRWNPKTAKIEPNPYYKTFWSKIPKPDILYAADSHLWAYAVFDMVKNKKATLYHFDWHHDALPAQEEVVCDNWLACLKKIRQTWNIVWVTPGEVELEKEPSIPLKRISWEDFGGIEQPPIGFVARSGAWVPPWCDDAFFEFIGGYHEVPGGYFGLKNRWTAEMKAGCESAYREIGQGWKRVIG